MLQHFLSLSLTLMTTSSIFAQSNTTLRLGDPAPPLKYSKWIKGTPITSFDPKHVYVIEFWATWCGPCRLAMPHLTELQKQYSGKVTFVGVDIWEDGKTGKSYEQFIPAVEKFVKENDSRLGYAVMIDDNSQSMSTMWMKAAGQEGIPSTFVINEGKVVWIGNPLSLDTLLPEILAGKYNIVQHKAVMEEELEKSRKDGEAWSAVFAPIQQALSLHNYDTALVLIDEVISQHPEYNYFSNYFKFSTLLKHKGAKEGIDFGNEWIKKDSGAAETILNAVLQDTTLPKRVYIWSARAYESRKANMAPYNYHRLATAYAMGGNFKKAAIHGQHAVDSAENILKGEAMVGVITVGMLEDYKKALAGYKKKQLIITKGK